MKMSHPKHNPHCLLAPGLRWTLWEGKRNAWKGAWRMHHGRFARLRRNRSDEGPLWRVDIGRVIVVNSVRFWVSYDSCFNFHNVATSQRISINRLNTNTFHGLIVGRGCIASIITIVDSIRLVGFNGSSLEQSALLPAQKGAVKYASS